MIRLTLSGRPGVARLACVALLFDMDGTLVDSRACVERKWRAWAQRHGLDTGALLRRSPGLRNEDTVRLFAPHLDQAGECVRLMREEEEMREGIIEVPGAAALLRTLPPQRWAVVTSAWRRLADIRLRCAGLPVPRVLVTADDTTHGKPDPEGYLVAAATLGVAPAGCVVLEDAPSGVTAARSAGMRVIGVATTFPADRLDCDWVVPDLTGVRVQTAATHG